MPHRPVEKCESKSNEFPGKHHLYCSWAEMQSTWDLKNLKIETKRGINLHLVHEILSHEKNILPEV